MEEQNFVETLIEEVKKKKCLYDKSDAFYLNKIFNVQSFRRYKTSYLLKLSPSSLLLRRFTMGRLGKVDPSSYSESNLVTTKHSTLNWEFDFENTKIRGSVIHHFYVKEAGLPSILLDVRDLNILDASIICCDSSKIPVNYFISDPVTDVGEKLTLELPQGTAKGDLLIQINYETSSDASGLQWLTPQQTLGKKYPYMFSQCQAIHARSILPCQDTPAVKFTYEATVQHPAELTALMSALTEGKKKGITTFKQEVPIPAYLLAIAIGKLVSRPLGPISNVWAEEGIIKECAEEFSECDKMIKTATELCGPYVWKQYDLLVMPPSFPFGGMENPCLTFVTPTLLAGDKSLADVVAHEIAHSWTGNLVTNKNFEHFWLNEGFTVFMETKIVGRMKGAKERDFHMLRNLTELRECLRTQLANNPELTKLVVDLSNCGPDDAFSKVPYIKGSTFLRYIEDLLGGPEVFEPFVRSYLKKFAYKSVITDDFKLALYDYFSKTDKKDKLQEIDWDLWLNTEGMPPIIPNLFIQIDYETSSEASGLQWLTPLQTLGKKHPYMFSQCQPIHARSILPCQDTPAVKFTYEATVQHPAELTALMSALLEDQEKGITIFRQEVPIPAYLLAIAIGKLVSRPLGPISNVWAEEGIIKDCAEEFSECDKMIKTATELCGPYVWKQYDLLVMPPSFPFGGMENPCLTFVTPTLLAGDKSLADVVAHEIAHSWTGNLVTNKNFEHFWLNEGFTVFMETKIVGRMKGAKERDFHMLRNLTELKECLRTQMADTPELTKLVVDLTNCTPGDAFSSVPYIKGSTFLRYIEDLLGGPEVFEPFLRSYIKKYAYKSITTDDFQLALYDYFSKTDKKDKLQEIDWDLWLNTEGMPPIIPKFDETLANISDQHRELWKTKTVAELKADLNISNPISIHQLIDFLGKLIECEDIVDLTEEKIKLLESTYNLKNSKNAEVRFRLMRLFIMAKLINRMDEILAFANSNFRMKFCRPIYRDLANWPEAKPIAVENFQKIKNEMMAACSHAIENDLGLK